ncbi:MAG: 3-phosphoshikimate 1-carboxyvinyltransferase [Pseudomonadota bacterium]
MQQTAARRDQKAPRLRAGGSARLKGEAVAPGDKSISHRALIFGAMAGGTTTIEGLLEGDDVLRTAAALRGLGALIERDMSDSGSVWRVTGQQWSAPQSALYCGNSGTGCRLIAGAVAGQLSDGSVAFDGDASLRKRPMGRIVTPLRKMGAAITLNGECLPMTVSVSGRLKGIHYDLPVASAQVKSAVLLAALGAEGETTVVEPVRSRDHTERMLKAFGVTLEITDGDGVRHLKLTGGQRLKATDVAVPGDPSSAAFPIVAALIVPESNVLVKDVLMNPLRIGIFETLKEMGADLSFENERVVSGEPVADIRAKSSHLKGVAVPASRAPSMIDEYPILSVAAAFASGDTYMPGIEELRVKETDRIDATEAMMKVVGVETDAGADWLRVVGTGGAAPRGGGVVATEHDHRIAMSALILGLATQSPVEIDDASMIETSFPTFEPLMMSLGANLTRVS